MSGPTTTSEIKQKWVVSEAESDQFVNKSNDILNSPACKISTQEIPVMTFYSKEQMVEMFHLGFKCKAMGPYKVLGKMPIGAKQIFPLETLFSVRNAASRLKKEHKKVFDIQKRVVDGKEQDVIVTRNK